MARLSRLGMRGLALAAVISLSACAAEIRNHGYVPSDTDLATIAVGVDDRDSVSERLGLPTTGGVLNESGFFYVASRWRYLGFLAPRIVDRQLVAVRFDGAGKVSNVERFTLRDGRVFPISRRVTEENVRDTTFLRQLLGNLGNFDASQVIGSDG